MEKYYLQQNCWKSTEVTLLFRILFFHINIFDIYVYYLIIAIDVKTVYEKLDIC
jgi:hypothetical protein